MQIWMINKMNNSAKYKSQPGNKSAKNSYLYVRGNKGVHSYTKLLSLCFSGMIHLVLISCKFENQ